MIIIQNSIHLLEQLSELEIKIQKLESLMDQLGIQEDRENLIRILLKNS